MAAASESEMSSSSATGLRGDYRDGGEAGTGGAFPSPFTIFELARIFVIPAFFERADRATIQLGIAIC